MRENEHSEKSNKKYLYLIVLMFLIPIPWITIRLLYLLGYISWSYENYAVISALLTGISIIAGAFLISWAAESSQEYLPPNLVLASIALINVIPEYVVDVYFTWVAGNNPEYKYYAISNMTGANRMLVGIVWPLILIVYLIARNREKKQNELPNYIQMEKNNILEMTFLIISTLYCFIIPMKGKLELMDTFVLFSIFVVYIYLATRMGKREPELEGPAYYISSLPKTKKIFLILSMFIFSGITFLASAKPFGESLLVVGSKIAEYIGFDPKLAKFLMVQWVAPIASESPEIIVVIIFAWKLLATDSFTTVVSSKINQWTLLVGFIPLIYFVSRIYHGHPGEPLVLDQLKYQEILLTAAQSLFASVILLDFKFTILKALLLFIPFFTQLINPTIRMEVTYVYLILSFLALFFVINKKSVAMLKESLSSVFGKLYKK
ncbi:MAG: sodium:calcium antiporter [Candidatus Calescibacterium sp.]|nr:sodium:calcium antiporter [Candidatus Calescibacterium sp.]MCX7972128.1 sodium:calcium antiporter [bacterium]MDW8194816.1 sodium:calcium antiporter [Candidatus Calescibacterium sp.]